MLILLFTYRWSCLDNDSVWWNDRTLSEELVEESSSLLMMLMLSLLLFLLLLRWIKSNYLDPLCLLSAKLFCNWKRRALICWNILQHQSIVCCLGSFLHRQGNKMDDLPRQLMCPLDPFTELAAFIERVVVSHYHHQQEQWQATNFKMLNDRNHLLGYCHVFFCIFALGAWWVARKLHLFFSSNFHLTLKRSRDQKVYCVKYNYWQCCYFLMICYCA